MTSKLKCPVCPYCGKPLHCGAELNVDGHNVEMWYCTNYACEQSEDLIGTREMWELVANRIQAKQDLEIARKALESISGVRGNIEDYYGGVSIHYQQMVLHMDEIATNALEQIDHIADVGKMVGQN